MSKWFGVIVVLNVLACALTCHTFNDTEMNAITREKKRMKVKVSGCIERVAFGGETMVALDIKAQDVPVLKKDSVRNMVKLSKLTIRYNNLGKIEPAAFRNTPRLLCVEFIHTKLTELHYGIFNNTPTLQEILLHHNRIDFIEEEVFSNVPNLQSLNLSYNKLEQINRNWFFEITSLKTIDFQHNLIKTVPRKAFIHLRNLQHISLDYNEITSIQAGAFEGLTKVIYLGLKRNLLKTLNVDAFPKQFTADSLFVDANKLNFLSEKVLQKVRAIGINGNPWKCPCIESLRTSVFARQGQIVGSQDCVDLNIPVCVEPKNATGKCEETEDDEVRGIFYDNVVLYRDKLTDCVQFN